jgi:signal transduction histidine kinase
LRDSRRRLVEAGNAERHRIERDLHDSAQQRLVALRVNLALVSERLDGPSERAALDALGDEVEEALADVRRVAHGLYAPTLDRYGVAEALRSACRLTPMPVWVIDEGLGRRSASIESTLYFCCLEAVQNAAKHAGPGASASVRLGACDVGVWFAVEDDGVGFDPAAAPGVGLTGLRERIAAMGGTLDIDSEPGGGTRVAGHFPA